MACSFFLAPRLRIPANFGDKNCGSFAQRTRRSGHPGETDGHRAIEKSRETRFPLSRFQRPRSVVGDDGANDVEEDQLPRDVEED
jgi:hypothetical protein